MSDVNTAMLHPELVQKMLALQLKCADVGIYIKFSEGYRTVAEQDALYAQGRTKPGHIVTNARGASLSSQHQWGIAVDFYLDMDVDGDGDKADDAFNNDLHFFNLVGTYAKQIGLGWGGEWKSFKDLPHLYLPQWGSTTTNLKTTYGSYEGFKTTWGENRTENPTVAGNVIMKEEEELSKNEYTRVIIGCLELAMNKEITGTKKNRLYAILPTVSKTKNRKHAVVAVVQSYLNHCGFDCGKVDGIAGDKFDSGLKSWQRTNGCVPDGELTAGKRSWRIMLGE